MSNIIFIDDTCYYEVINGQISTKVNRCGYSREHYTHLDDVRIIDYKINKYDNKIYNVYYIGENSIIVKTFYGYAVHMKDAYIDSPLMSNIESLKDL